MLSHHGVVWFGGKRHLTCEHHWRCQRAHNGEKLEKSSAPLFQSLLCDKGDFEVLYSNENVFDRHHVSLHHVWSVCGALVNVRATTVALNIPGSGRNPIYIIENTDVIPWSKIQSRLRSSCRHSGCAWDKVVVDKKIVATALLMPLVVHRIHKTLQILQVLTKST